MDFLYSFWDFLVTNPTLCSAISTFALAIVAVWQIILQKQHKELDIKAKLYDIRRNDINRIKERLEFLIGNSECNHEDLKNDLDSLKHLFPNRRRKIKCTIKKIDFILNQWKSLSEEQRKGLSTEITDTPSIVQELEKDITF